MAEEPRRGCGYRKVGGLYMVGDQFDSACDRLPSTIRECGACGHMPPQARAFGWLKAWATLGNTDSDAKKKKPKGGEFWPRWDSEPPVTATLVNCSNGEDCDACVLCNRHLWDLLVEPNDRVGIVWVGGAHYPTRQSFLIEAVEMGVSRRISMLPKDFIPGSTYVLIAHPKSGTPNEPEEQLRPQIIAGFMPRLEYIVSEKTRDSRKAQAYKEQGVKLVEFSSQDPDHMGGE